MAELAAQWPVLALVLALLLGAGRVIQGQYEDRIRELREEVELWRRVALQGTTIAEAVTTAAERHREVR